MEIVTQALSPQQIRTEVPHIVEFFRAHGTEDLLVGYGWACNLEIDELWQDIETTAELLPHLIDLRIADGRYPIGKADFLIKDRGGHMEFLLCHESDVHYKSAAMDLVEQVKQQWMKRGYSGYEKFGEQAPWVPFSP